MKIEALIVALREIFEDSGEIIDIVAKKHVKAKGQAFIVFENADSAADALEDFQGFDFFGRPMTLAYAKTESDATVQKTGNAEELEAHKRHRMAEKERKAAAQVKEANKLKRAAPEAQPDEGPPQKKGLKSTSAKSAGIVPDEYLPPNKTLFVQNVPEDYDVDSLTAVFQRYEGFRDARLVPGRKGLAFIEYEAEQGSISAKEATAGMVLEGGVKPIKVTFQRQ